MAIKNIGFQVEEGTHRRIKMACAKSGHTLREFVGDAIQEKLSEYESNAPDWYVAYDEDIQLAQTSDAARVLLVEKPTWHGNTWVVEVSNNGDMYAYNDDAGNDIKTLWEPNDPALKGVTSYYVETAKPEELAANAYDSLDVLNELNNEEETHHE